MNPALWSPVVVKTRKVDADRVLDEFKESGIKVKLTKNIEGNYVVWAKD